MRRDYQGIILALTVLFLFAWIIVVAYWSSEDVVRTVEELRGATGWLVEWF